jgi:hypothetical protein
MVRREGERQGEIRRVSRTPIRLPRRIGPVGRTTEYSPNDWTPAEVARRIAYEPIEWLYVFDPRGRQIARFRGTSGFVDLNDELKAHSQGLYGESVLRNHLVVHNHPVTTGRDAVPSFPASPSDLIFAVERDLREIVVVSGDWRYVVRRPGDCWPTDEHSLLQIIIEIGANLDRAAGSTEGTPVAAVRRLRAILRRLAEEGWIDYESSLSTGSD